MPEPLTSEQVKRYLWMETSVAHPEGTLVSFADYAALRQQLVEMTRIKDEFKHSADENWHELVNTQRALLAAEQQLEAAQRELKRLSPVVRIDDHGQVIDPYERLEQVQRERDQ